MKLSKLTVLSFGAGQDSTLILLNILNSKTFRNTYAPGWIVVVMSDTGDEHPYTYMHVQKMRSFCKQKGIPFFFLTSDMGYHAPSWPDLMTPQKRESNGKYKPTLVQVKTKSCTHQLKISPIYKWLDEYLNEKFYGGEFKVYEDTRGCKKKAVKQYLSDHGRVSFLLGFATGEEKRADASLRYENKILEESPESWEAIIARRFPLIELGIDRKKCQAYLEKLLPYKVFPSNCMRCPYQNKAEILWLAKCYPKKFEEWAQVERKKIERGKDIDVKNYGVKANKKLLPQILIEATEEYGDWSIDELNDYKYSHGCQTNSM